ncbi:hypothetical protein [Actinomadura decatromicini]|uniref:Uncharacterized protein n=1 Tax=Actinomadura decatromicini TaxID=2604572 RepID=A0A5D3FGG4_9ACTN|nr:hypothetical protein [Actinomadura decatromicini]TYK47179.1 hypothetical protein FXF68_25610 [Actinomadura decatromicini]
MAHDPTDARVRALEAERLQPTPPRPPRRAPGIDPGGLAELLDEAAGREPTQQQTEAAARLEDYTFARDTGDEVEMAAARVGITPATAKSKYEPLYRKGKQQ